MTKKKTISHSGQARSKESIAVEKLQRAFELGSSTLEQARIIAEEESVQPTKIHRDAAIKITAQQNGMTTNDVSKCVRFAERYTPKEFKELMQLRTPKGMPLTLAHMDWILQIKNKDQRARFQNQAAKGGWSVETTKEEKANRFGKGNNSGRPPKQPANSEEALSKVIGECESWINWRRKSDDSNLPEELAKSLRKTSREIERLREVAKKHLESSP